MATKLSPVGSEFQVNQAIVGSVGIAHNQERPDVVPLTDGRFVVVYDSNFNITGTDIDIHAHFINANGTLSGATTGSPDPDSDIYYTFTNVAGVNGLPRTLLMDDPAFALLQPDIATMPD